MGGHDTGHWSARSGTPQSPRKRTRPRGARHGPVAFTKRTGVRASDVGGEEEKREVGSFVGLMILIKSVLQSPTTCPSHLRGATHQTPTASWNRLSSCTCRMIGHEDAHSSTVMLTVICCRMRKKRVCLEEFLSHVPTELFSWCLEGASISQLRIVPAAYGALEETWSILEKVRIVS